MTQDNDDTEWVPNGIARMTATRTLTADVKVWSPFDRKDYATRRTQTLHFQWYGGAYIEVGLSLGRPVEVINVWNFATDKPTIARTRRAFRAKVDDWIANYNEDDPALSVQSLMQDATNW